jgi:hypothetical protein
MLISVMRDDISCEEAFEVKAEMAPEPVVADGVDLGRLFDRIRAPRDWAGSEFADAVYGPEVEEEEVCWCKFFESCPSCFGKK